MGNQKTEIVEYMRMLNKTCCVEEGIEEMKAR
jgi:hypothetical protein